MLSVSNVSSMAIVPYIPSGIGMFLKRVCDVFTERSWKTQIADQAYLYPMTLRDRILMGNYRELENGPGLPTPFRGTRKELLKLITDTVHRTIDGFDYNGALPYVKIIDQFEEGKSFDEVEIDS